MSDNRLLHFGTKRHSGRYPWGSGDSAYQGEKFLYDYEQLLAKGTSEKEIAKELGFNTTELRTNITWARKEQRKHLMDSISKMRESGMTKVAISKELNVSEATVRNYISPVQKHQAKQLDAIQKDLEKAIEKSTYLDVGIGVELQLGVPRTRFNAVVLKMAKEDGYFIHEIYVQRLNDRLKPTTLKVLTKEPDMTVVRNNSDLIRPLNSWSDDGGETIHNLAEPKSFDVNKVKIRYAEEGGVLKDGVIELRPGVEDLDMGSSRYQQVRIRVGEDRFLKGMAVYGDPKDFPEGVDIIFNTNKSSDVPLRDVLKKTKDDTDNIFGSTIKPQFQNESRVINVVNEEGDWDTWSASLPSQFLGKQPVSLIKERLDATSEAFRKDLDELSSLNNPIVQQVLLEGFAGSMNSKAQKLSAKGLRGTKNHVILPFPDMNPNEIYAPNYQNGDRVVLIRYPHGGVFEIPEVTVNNKYQKAKDLLGMAPDAIGVHPAVAQKLSGADFDGDTVYVIPNPLGRIKTSRALKELKNFDPMDYKVDYETITKKHLGTEMGLASNLITDMTIKGASQSEIARAVKHSMVVIDSFKHKLDYKKSKEDNGIKALRKEYQSHINPDTGKKTTGASTLLSRSKSRIDLDKPDFDVSIYSSGTEKENLYVKHVQNLQVLKNEAEKKAVSVTLPKYDPDAAKIYKPEVDSLNIKLIKAKENAPRERQAQVLASKLYYSSVTPDMDKDSMKKLKNRSVARARTTVGAKKDIIDITDGEWQAIQSKAISNTKLKEILRNADRDRVRELATPRTSKLTSPKAQRAKSMLDNGHTYAEVAQALGVSTGAIRGMLTEDD